MTRSGAISTVALAVALGSGCSGGDALDESEPTAAAVPGPPAAPVAGFRGVVEEVIPAIVFIQTEATPPAGLGGLLPGLPPLRDEPIPVGIGSGVLFSEDGYILTNHHVVRDAERVRVVLQDRRHFEADVVGLDPATEVAVVRIPGNGFPVAVFGDSDAVGPGDWVLALGSPLGLEFSVSAGVVSGVGRAIGILGGQVDAAQAAPLEHFIQTDASLSPGNSGGALVNSAGQVIGINTAVAAHPGVPGSVGFAIPSNLARHVAEQLIRHGRVQRAYLGISLVNVTPSMAAAEGLERVEGSVVARVEPGSPAAMAGLREGDLIMEISGQRVGTVSDLQNQLVRLDPGTTVPLMVVREGRMLTLPVQLGSITSGETP